MPGSTEKIMEQMTKVAEKQRENGLAAESRADVGNLPIAPVTSLDEEVQSDRPVKDEFYLLPPKNPKKTTEKEKEDNIKIAICYQGVCIPVDMNLATALNYCAAANALLNSANPNDRARAEKAWNLLAQGHEAASLEMLGIRASARSTAQQAVKELTAPPDTKQKPQLSEQLKNLEKSAKTQDLPNKTSKYTETPSVESTTPSPLSTRPKLKP